MIHEIPVVLSALLDNHGHGTVIVTNFEMVVGGSNDTIGLTWVCSSG